jgi:phage-related protein
MITLGIDPSKAKSGMRDATNTVKSGTKEITSSVKLMASSIEAGLGAVTKIFTGFGGALMGAFSIGSAFSTWKEQASEFGAVSRNLKMNIADVQGWVGAMGKFGGTSSDFENNLRGLNAQLAKMATLGTSRTGKLLESLGIDAGGIGRQRDALAVLEDIAGVVEQMSPDESRGVLQALGFDSSMIMLLQQGREGMKDLIRQKKEDAVYTQEDADAIKQYNVAMGGLKKGFMGIASTLFRMIMPALTVVTQYVSAFVKAIRKHQVFLKAFFTMIALLVTGLLIPAFIQFGKTLMRNPFTWVILALAGIALVIEDLIVWMDGGKSALDDFWEALFGNRENAKATFETIKNGAKSAWEAITNFFSYISSGQAWRDLKDRANESYNLIRDKIMILVRDWNAFCDRMRSRWDAVTSYLPNKWAEANAYIEAKQAEASEWIANNWQWLTDTINSFLQYVSEIVEQVYAWIQSLISSCIDAVMAKWEEFKSRAVNAVNAVRGAIDNLANAIRQKISGAIDWAIAKLSALKNAITGGSFDINVSSAGATYGGGGSSYYEGNSSETSIGSVNVYTQATDANGIAGDMSSAIYGSFNPMQSNGGFR